MRLNQILFNMIIFQIMFYSILLIMIIMYFNVYVICNKNYYENKSCFI